RCSRRPGRPVAITRRHLLTAGAAGAGVLAAGAVGLGVGHATTASEPASTVGAEPFFGAHQAGIATAQQDRMFFAAYDVTVSSAAALRKLLADWTVAASRMTGGLDAAPDAASVASPPADAGEATGLDPAHLTITFGLGPGLFDRDGIDRFGLRSR